MTTSSLGEVDVLVACSALAGAAAHLASTLQTSGAPWRARAQLLIDAATALGGATATLRSVRSSSLRRQQVDRIGRGADDAVAHAMRLHNLLPKGDAGAAAFDVAACAIALGVAARALAGA